MATKIGFFEIAVLALLAFAVFGGEKAPAGTNPVSPDLCTVVQPSASFTGQNLYLTGTAVSTEYVRVIKNGGTNNDLGQISLNSGALNTAPGVAYRLYYGENGSTYYTHKVLYNAPCQDAVDNQVGKMCTIDTAPTITVKDEFGQVMSSTANVQSIATSGEKTVTVRITAAADKCFGNPDAANENGVKTNAICFDYPSSNYSTIKTDKQSISAPYNISNSKAAGSAEICYPLDLVADTKYVEVPVTIKAVSGIDPGALYSNITVKIDDVDMDLDADTLQEIWNFQDENNNALGAPTQTATIYIS